MKRYFASILCLSALCFSPCTAQNDPVASCCETTYGFYLGAYGGGSWWHDGFFNSSTAPGDLRQYEPDKGFVVGAFAGYRCCNGIRLEVDVARREHDMDRVFLMDGSARSNEDLVSSTFASWSYMGNIIFEGTWPTCDCCFRPFYGFGLGVTSLKMRANHTDLLVSDSDMAFAYQLIIGIAWPFNDCFDLAVEYRWFGMDELTLDAQVSSTASQLHSRSWQGQHSFIASAKKILGSLW